MATYRFLLYKRHYDGVKPCPLKIVVYKQSKSSFIPTNFSLLPSQWNQKEQKVKNHPQKEIINRYLRQLAVKLDNAYNLLGTQYELMYMSAKEIAVLLSRKIYNLAEDPQHSTSDTSLLSWFKRCIQHKKGKTASVYEFTLNVLIRFKGEEKLSVLRLDSIKKEWLLEFEDWMTEKGMAVNTRGIHFRNLRHVFNYAIDNEATKNYPFRNFKIQKGRTRKRNLKIDKIREIFAYRSERRSEQRYLDAFKLSFLLIGINIKDLCLLKSMKNGYIEFTRAKTKTPYSIKVEPEALELIKKYKGRKHLLNYIDNTKDYKNFYRHLAGTLRDLKERFKLEEMTTYYARHSWATIASALNIPKDTIAAALGHASNTVTDIYIEYDMNKVDEANRKVLDYVLYGKEG